MKNDEFAFFNQQLAAMLRDGIPLEGALRRLCADLRHSPLRTELEMLETDLARGTPLAQAVRARQLPELYQQMLEVGAKSNDLPGVLTLLADHYQRSHALWTRLKGLMVYPTLVLIAAFLLSCFLGVMSHRFIITIVGGMGMRLSEAALFWIQSGYLIVPSILALLVAAILTVNLSPALRRFLRWRVPAFREASLAQIASSMAMMLKSGVPLDQALALVSQLEKHTPAGADLNTWRRNLATGRGKFSGMADGTTVFPPLFVWMVGQAGEDLAGGFQRVAEAFNSRAAYRSDLLLYSALPCSVLALGALVLTQIQPVIFTFQSMISSLAN